MMYGYGNMGGLAALWVVVWLVVIGVVVVSLWRGMLAQERMARQIEAIARSLAERAGRT